MKIWLRDFKYEFSLFMVLKHIKYNDVMIPGLIWMVIDIFRAM